MNKIQHIFKENRVTQFNPLFLLTHAHCRRYIETFVIGSRRSLSALWLILVVVIPTAKFQMMLLWDCLMWISAAGADVDYTLARSRKRSRTPESDDSASDDSASDDRDSVRRDRYHSKHKRPRHAY
jgi:hypothetical protein